jgi:hypothetical protein
MAEMNGKKDDGMNKCPMCGGSGMMSGKGCCCGYHGGMMGYGFGWGLIRVIVGLIVLGIVFSLGVLIGELKIAVGGGFMYRGGMMGQNYFPGAYPMMGNWNNGMMATSTTVR